MPSSYRNCLPKVADTVIGPKKTAVESRRPEILSLSIVPTSLSVSTQESKYLAQSFLRSGDWIVRRQNHFSWVHCFKRERFLPPLN